MKRIFTRKTSCVAPRKTRGGSVCLAAVFAVCGFVHGSVSADEGGYDEKFNTMSDVISDLSAHPQSKETRTDIELVRTWVANAQAMAAAEKHEAVGSLFERIDAQTEYVKARQTRLATEYTAAKIEAELSALTKRASEQKGMLEKAAMKQKKLEESGL